MSNFKLYAQYYNLLYKDKNYQAEAAYVDQLIKQRNKQARTMLNLGCGTGKHDLQFLKLGYQVTGIDLSANMIKEAQKYLSRSAPGAKAEFLEGDVRTFRGDNKFDVVVSLFHVISYQTTNQDVLKMFETAAYHLSEGGLFIFDCWYGPGVLTDPPVTRVKRLEDETIQVTRIAEPVMHANNNVVDVNYEVIISDKQENGKEQHITETHPMRYFFTPEISLFAAQAKFQVLGVEEWMTGKEPGFSSWNTVFICKK